MIIVANRWTKIDPQKDPHLGHMHERAGGQRSHDKRCDYCGKWIVYDVKNIAEWGDNVKIGLHRWPEKVHCGSTHCTDYHKRVLKHEEKLKEQTARASERLFLKLKKKGVLG